MAEPAGPGGRWGQREPRRATAVCARRDGTEERPRREEEAGRVPVPCQGSQTWQLTRESSASRRPSVRKRTLPRGRCAQGTIRGPAGRWNRAHAGPLSGVGPADRPLPTAWPDRASRTLPRWSNAPPPRAPGRLGRAVREGGTRSLPGLTAAGADRAGGRRRTAAGAVLLRPPRARARRRWRRTRRPSRAGWRSSWNRRSRGSAGARKPPARGSKARCACPTLRPRSSTRRLWRRRSRPAEAVHPDRNRH